MIVAGFYCMKMTDKKRNYNHVDLNLVESYLRHKKYPDDISNKGEKANFRRACKKFSIVDGQFKFDGNRLVITDEKRRKDIIYDLHEGLGDNIRAAAMGSHLGRTSTQEKVSNRK